VDLKKFPSISALLIPLGIAGSIFMGWLTPFGVGIYVDSLYYVSSARSLVAGIGMGRVTGLGVFKPMTHYPPFYSLVLAFFRLLGLPELTSARWISMAAFGLTIILVGLIVYQRTHSRFFSLFCAILILVSNPILRNFSWAMTEPLYILLMLASLLYFATYIRTTLRRWLILAAIFASLALLTRYVGFALVGALSLVLILNRQISWRRHLQELAIFLSITLIPTLLWLLRNWLVSETLTNRAIVWHPISNENVAFLIKAVNSWGLLPQRLVVGHERIAFVVILIGLSSVGLWWFIRSLRKHAKTPTQEFTLLSFSWFYIGLLGVSLFFLDATTRLENRILLPLYVLILILIVIGSALLWQQKKRLPRLAVILICMWLAYFSFTRVNGAIIDLRSDSQGYASLQWQNSPTAGFIRQQDTSLIYTNDVTAIYFLAGKNSEGIPNANSSATDLAQMRANLSTPDSYLVIFGTLTGEFAPLEKLTTGLTLVGSFDDGNVYQIH
jgi:4-amino-4-deoxy-L-arabinose transferase-like glycosyltransferase